MTQTSKQTPLTVENFQKLFMEEINGKFSGIDRKFKGINKQFVEMRKDITTVIHKVNELTEKVDDMTESIKYLPTTEVYLASQDKVMNELQKSREATEFTGQHYEDTNERIDKIDGYLNIDSRLAID